MCSMWFRAVFGVIISRDDARRAWRSNTFSSVVGPRGTACRRGCRSTGAMRVAAFVLAVLVGAGLGGALVAVGASEPGQPVPLAGLPLRGASYLHLLVADNPPFVLAVDTGRVTPVRAP